MLSQFGMLNRWGFSHCAKEGLTYNGCSSASCFPFRFFTVLLVVVFVLFVSRMLHFVRSLVVLVCCLFVFVSFHAIVLCLCCCCCRCCLLCCLLCLCFLSSVVFCFWLPDCFLFRLLFLLLLCCFCLFLKILESLWIVALVAG